MKKKKLSSLPRSTNVDDLGDVLTNGPSGFVFSNRLIADLRPDLGIQDANLMYLSKPIGLSIGSKIYTTQNVPGGTDNGLIIHFQRSEKGVVTASQVIWQICFVLGTVYSRTGLGNGTTINYTQWVAL
jgi:hypothetical protein